MSDDLMNEIAAAKDKSSIIMVVGVGGAGGNAVNHMWNLGIKDVGFMVCNTDAQALDNSPVEEKVQLGREGLGAGNDPENGRKAAIESLDDIRRRLEAAGTLQRLSKWQQLSHRTALYQERSLAKPY